MVVIRSRRMSSNDYTRQGNRQGPTGGGISPRFGITAWPGLQTPPPEVQVPEVELVEGEWLDYSPWARAEPRQVELVDGNWVDRSPSPPAPPSYFAVPPEELY